MEAKIFAYAGLVFLFASGVQAEPQTTEKCIQHCESERIWSPFVQGLVSYGRTDGRTFELFFQPGPSIELTNTNHSL